MKLKLGPIDFTQPSTWRGILGLAGLFGIAISPQLADQIALAVGAGLSAIEIFRNERAAQIALPPIQLQSQSQPELQNGALDRPVGVKNQPLFNADELRENDLLSHGRPESGPVDRDPPAGWNG